MVKGDCGTILVVDDDDSTRLAAVQVAVRLGYDVRAAENAELVLERLDDTTPALAIVKVELPGMSGLEVMRELHDRFGDELPVILLAHETDALERTAHGDKTIAVALNYGSQQEIARAATKAADEQLKLFNLEVKANRMGMGHWTERGTPTRQTSLIMQPANGRIPPPTPLG